MSLGDQELMAIMATFKSFDVDGDGSLDKKELANILYRISKEQSFEEIDQEVEDIMDACDKDNSGQISYAEFFSTQKKHDFSPKAQAAIEKLTRFMALQENAKQVIIKENNDTFSRLKKEKEEAIQRELEEAEEDRHRRENVAMHGTPLIGSPHPSSSPLPDSAPAEGDLHTTASFHEDIEPHEASETQEDDLKEKLAKAHERIAHLEQALAKLETSSTGIQQELNNQLIIADKDLKKVEADRTKSVQELEQSLQVVKKDLDASRKINETITQENKALKDSDKSGTVESLRAKIRELENTIIELNGSLDLARQQNPDKETDEELVQLRFALAEKKEEVETLTLKQSEIQAELNEKREQLEKAIQISSSNAEVAHKAAMDAKNKEIAEIKKQLEIFRAKNDELAAQNKQSEGAKQNLEVLRTEHLSLKNVLAAERQSAKDENRNLTELSRKAALDVQNAAEQVHLAQEERDAAIASVAETTAQLKLVENALNDKTEETKRREEELLELRKEIKQLQLQNLKMSTEILPPPARHVEVDEESPAMVEQRQLRERVQGFRRTLKLFHIVYFFWVIIVLYIAYVWGNKTYLESLQSTNPSK